MRDNLGVMLGATVNIISEEMGNQMAQVRLDFGVNKIPTLEEAIEAVNTAIAEASEMTGVSDWRVTRMSDFGFADSNLLQWPPRR